MLRHLTIYAEVCIISYQFWLELSENCNLFSFFISRGKNSYFFLLHRFLFIFLELLLFTCYAFWILHPNHLPFPSWFLVFYIFAQCFEGRLEFSLLNYLFRSQEWPESSNCLLNCLVGKLCCILNFRNVSFGLNPHKCSDYFYSSYYLFLAAQVSWNGFYFFCLIMLSVASGHLKQAIIFFCWLSGVKYGWRRTLSDSSYT